MPVEAFLMMDPSVALTASIAERRWNPSAVGAILAVAICLLIPRVFCGYACPLGTVLDISDKIRSSTFQAVFNRRKTRHPTGGLHKIQWRYVKYVLLGVVTLSAVFGVSLAGYIAPIPILTRAFVFLLAPVQTAYYRGLYQVPAPNVGVYVSLGIFVVILLLGAVHHRFWCRNLCPSGAIFSLVGYIRIFGKKVDTQKCNGCSRCVSSCNFGAISPQAITTSPIECASCLQCQADCPKGAVSFGRNDRLSKRSEDYDSKMKPSQPEGRRRFFQVTLFGAAGLLGVIPILWSRIVAAKPGDNLIRPPGSVPEEIFLKRCVRCGECLRACPNDALQPCGLEFGENNLWTPRLVADWSGCEPSCNNCGRVCPTEAIRAIPLEEKRACRIGLAVVNLKTCLPYAGREECQICVDECHKAGYDAIEFMRVGTKIDENGEPLEGSGYLAPVVLADKCIGCGLCQTRCRAINAVQKGYLSESAIQVIAGDSNEDRLLTGSYRELRDKKEKPDDTSLPETKEDDYLPDFLK